jgi:hypothetical protein
MANEKREPQPTDVVPQRAAQLPPDAPPQIVGDEKEHLFVSPHDLSEDVDPNYAGEYELIHGTVRLPVSDGKGGFIPRGKVVRAGAKLRLSALDAHRFLEAKVVKRIDGRTPDKVDARVQ